MLRVAAAIRDELGRDALGPVVTAYGHSYWDPPQGSGMRDRLSTTEHVVEVLAAAGLPARFADALDDTSWDILLDAESELALSRTGRDVGTPIITFQPPDGLSFFGPVISRVPNDAEALELWDAVTTLAKFPGFTEIKRSMRERPQLNILGGVSDALVLEDWQGGHRRGHPGQRQHLSSGIYAPASASAVSARGAQLDLLDLRAVGAGGRGEFGDRDHSNGHLVAGEPRTAVAR